MTVQELEEKADIPPPSGLRGRELLDWARYLEAGGAIYPLSVLSGENDHCYVSDVMYYKSKEERLRRGILDEDIDAVKKVLESYPGLVNHRYERQWTPLHVAARSLKAEIVDYLLSMGADVNACTHKGRSALHLVSQFPTDCAAGILKKLLKAGGTSFVKDVDNLNVYHWCANNNNTKGLKILKKHEPELYDFAQQQNYF
eukprot:TRINITY_DN4838_c0_g1_i3.p1 TRINITY_DN4838_c0_g1~~TRINITY_DN4838_c0_g1_i3.p1  ORF type:complete len:200 (+),score=47.87 TRINITY_DN4838_c0_g1_i3:468-1067(+)